MRIFISNFPRDTTKGELRALLSPFGGVAEIKIISERESGVVSGFTFVNMPILADALCAVTALDGAQYRRRKLTVEQARPRKPAVPPPVVAEDVAYGV